MAASRACLVLRIRQSVAGSSRTAAGVRQQVALADHNISRIVMLCRPWCRLTGRSVLTARAKSHFMPLVRLWRNNVSINQQISETLSPRARRCVGGWLVACSGLTYATVVVGGVTRLTGSGLSMVDWHLFKEFPPLDSDMWATEFEKYQQFPEFQQANYDMTLEQFKKIWWMEYLHRMMGRAVGAVFLIPAAFFWYKGWFVKGMRRRVPLFGGLVLMQGLIGWWMVKSGLTEENAAKYSDPQVSHYRLATHLSGAFILYSLFVWSALSHLLPPESLPATSNLIRVKRLAHTSKALIFLTAISGAFVAGLDAGLIYNTYPRMGNSLIPSDLLAQKPVWKNFVENPTATQFDHRLLGHLTAASVLMTWICTRTVSSPRLRLASTILLIAVVGQVALGISTLISSVPKTLASAHQASALALLTSALVLTHELKLVQRIPK